MLTPDLGDVRERMVRLINEAHENADFKALLLSDPGTAMSRFNLTFEEVRRNYASDDRLLAATQPPGCVDYTCIASECPGTCYVTILEI